VSSLGRIIQYPSTSDRRPRIRDRQAALLVIAARGSLDAAADPLERRVLGQLVRRLDVLSARAQAGIGARS
jgi:hypothetical protein